MTPKEYEELVAHHFTKLGYAVESTPYSGDYGVDVFATKGSQRIAVQAKMYGNARKINREMVMALHGAKDYFDCTQAVIVTDGEIEKTASKVAEKLSVDVIRLPAEHEESVTTHASKIENQTEFSSIWKEYIMPLEGRVLHRLNGETNEILKVDWAGIKRITSNGKVQKIKIEAFKSAINHILHDGSVTRDQINQEYAGRASSGIVLILEQVPLFETTHNPLTVRLRSRNMNKTEHTPSSERLAEQIRFVLEADKLKGVLRRSYLTDGSRSENDAEHSWHLALMALFLAEHSALPHLDLLRVVGMLLIHDLVEIDAGDTFLYDTEAAVSQGERERESAERIFSLLPSDQTIWLRSLWEEFEARETAEAKFARALDRLQPLLLNYSVKGRAWQENGVTFDMAMKRLPPIIEDGSPELGHFAVELLERAKELGYFPG